MPALFRTVEQGHIACLETCVDGGLLPMNEMAASRPEDVGLCSGRIERVETWMRRQISPAGGSPASR